MTPVMPSADKVSNDFNHPISAMLVTEIRSTKATYISKSRI